jgi:hypothetical protein
MANKKEKEKSWKHAGGGCMVSDGGKYPCDDTYVNVETKEEVSVLCTMDAHFQMPEFISTKEELLKMEGVKSSS